MALDPQHIENIPKILSEARFERYLILSGNNKPKALELYEWNLKISSSFFIPISIAEVTIRNAIAESLSKTYRPDWHKNNGFLRSLPNPPPPNYSPRRNLENLREQHRSVGKVIADLNLAFWEGMMTKRHEIEIWDKTIRASFPNSPQEITIAEVRKTIHESIFNIRTLRNRIAHHEPIFFRNLKEDYNSIYQLVMWRDKPTADWMHEIQSVTELINKQKDTIS